MYQNDIILYHYYYNYTTRIHLFLETTAHHNYKESLKLIILVHKCWSTYYFLYFRQR